MNFLPSGGEELEACRAGELGDQLVVVHLAPTQGGVPEDQDRLTVGHERIVHGSEAVPHVLSKLPRRPPRVPLRVPA